MGKGDNDGPVLTKLEVVCNDIVCILFDLVLVMSVLDTTEVPGDNIRSCTRHNSLFRFIYAGVETCCCEGDGLSHSSNMLRLEMKLDCLGLRKQKAVKKTHVSMQMNAEHGHKPLFIIMHNIPCSWQGNWHRNRASCSLG